MGLYFLYFLLFIFAPLGYGAALAVFLKEFHLRQLGITTEPEITDSGPEIAAPEETETPEPAVEEEVEPVAETAAETTAEPIVEEQPAAEPPLEVPQDAPESVAEAEEPELPPVAPKSVFDDHGLLPKSFKADEVIDGMLDEGRSETPEDLSSRIEAEGSDFPQDFEDDPLDFDDDVLARAMEVVGGESDIDFSGEEPHPDAISPSVRDLLGEDFDFDSLTGEATPEIEVTLREPAEGVFQAETVAATQGLSSPELLSENHEIVSVFPEEMVQDTVIEPDHSDAARQNSFVEETRPMFVKRGK